MHCGLSESSGKLRRGSEGEAGGSELTRRLSGDSRDRWWRISNIDDRSVNGYLINLFADGSADQHTKAPQEYFKSGRGASN